ncbi:MAG: hypothetical protein HND44_14585 [Chloroflexi bacterium]|nr:hypothetical protein [Ardenticatenaceae bacterium]MBL1129690.1 hypothetical protein [Chloroflexota bacterium]NOG35771.1 hypothetical protein [Chloroflexota bacterium]GIK58821.1 MAG: hypothetical protein BroJett015_44840 [Chloroflexota bacterium]
MLYALLLIAFALRLHGLASQSIWWDEGISLNLARSPLPTILADRLNNIHPPLYFLLLKGWTTLTGLNAFSGRYFSTLASLLQVAAVYAVCRRWFRNPYAVNRNPKPDYGLWITDYGLPLTARYLPLTPLLAAFFITISPLSVIYAQEARAYALLPLATLALLAITWEIRDWRLEIGSKSPISPSPHLPISYWLALALIEWFALHLHYVMLFPVVYVSGWLLLAFLKERRWRDLRRLVVTQVVVGIVCLPWFTAVLRNWTAVQAEANAGTYLSEPAPLDFLFRQVWVFHHTGLTGALARPGVWELSALLLVVTAVLTLLRLITVRSPLTAHRFPLTATRLLLQWALPLSGALLVWTVRSFSHPRYIAFAAISFIPLAAYLMAPGVAARNRVLRFVDRLLAAVLFLLLVILSLVGLRLYFFDPQMAKDDMRGVAEYLAVALTPADLIIVPDAGWAFPFEYAGDTAVVMPHLSDPDGLWTRLAEWTAVPQRRIALVSAASGLAQGPAVVRFALEQAGSLVETRPFDGLIVQIYEIERTAAAPDWTPLDIWFGPLQLTGFWAEPGAAADTAVALALRWQLNQPSPDRHTAVLSLLNAAGLPLAQWDDVLVAGDGRPTELWSTGEVVTTTHVLPLPWGTLPQPVTVRLGVNDRTAGSIEARNSVGQPQGVMVDLPQIITVQPANRPGGNPYALPPELPRLPASIAVTEGLWLTAVGQDRGQIGGGQLLRVVLEWQATSLLPALNPHLQLVQNGQVLADAPVTVQFPIDRWRAGEVVLEHDTLAIPAGVESGTAVLLLTLNGEQIPIGQVEIVASDHNFTPPTPQMPLGATFGDVAQLVGFDAPFQVMAGEPIPLTLYWQAVGDNVPAAYTVFVHLLAADGRLIGQHDAPPANGDRPTTGWITGEYITDPHTITFREPGYTGPAQIAVGLYDPATGVRLTLADGTDRVVLPGFIEVSRGQ